MCHIVQHKVNANPTQKFCVGFALKKSDLLYKRHGVKYQSSKTAIRKCLIYRHFLSINEYER